MIKPHCKSQENIDRRQLKPMSSEEPVDVNRSPERSSFTSQHNSTHSISATKRSMQPKSTSTWRPGSYYSGATTGTHEQRETHSGGKLDTQPAGGRTKHSSTCGRTPTGHSSPLHPCRSYTLQWPRLQMQKGDQTRNMTPIHNDR